MYPIIKRVVYPLYLKYIFKMCPVLENCYVLDDMKTIIVDKTICFLIEYVNLF